MGRTSRGRRPCARGEVLCAEPGRPHPCPAGHAGPAHEGEIRTMSMHADEESDEGVVPMKRANNEGLSSAGTVDGRSSPKGNGGRTAPAPTHKDIHPEGGRLQATTQHSVSGGQDRSTGRGVSSGGHLRGGFTRLFVWIPNGARTERCAGRSPRRDLPEASELGARFGYPGLFGRCFILHPWF